MRVQKKLALLTNSDYCEVVDMADKFKKQMEESANRLREIRLNMGISQEKFAEYLDISLSAYKKIESAENGISVKILRRLKEKFNISSDFLLYGDYKNLDDALEIIQNCSEADKMKIFLRLIKYFVNDKKQIFVDSDALEDDSADIINNILDRK